MRLAVPSQKPNILRLNYKERIIMFCTKSASVAGILLGFGVLAQAAVVSLTMEGTGSGSLNGVSFTDAAWTWSIEYDTAHCTQPWANGNLFTEPVSSTMTIQGFATPINITQEHGLYAIVDLGCLGIGTIRTKGTTPEGDILYTVDNTKPAWNGMTSYTASGGVTAYFNQFTAISTDQGGLDMASGTLQSIQATAVPEPASSAVIFALAAGGFVVLRRARR